MHAVSTPISRTVLFVLIAACIAVIAIFASVNALGGLAPKKVTQQVSGLSAALSFDDVMAESQLIVEATATGSSDAYLIEPASGASPRFFHDARFKVDRVLDGEPIDAEGSSGEIEVRMLGGSGDLVETVAADEPSFATGSTYLLFLYRETEGGSYRTEGGSYGIVGGQQGVWPLEGGAFRCPLADAGSIGDLAQGDAPSFIARNRSNVPARVGDDEADGAARIEADYQAGRITATQRDEQVAALKAEFSGFAHVMTASEQEAWERAVAEQGVGGMGVAS